MKTCPYCMKEDLSDKAKRCPYCGTWLTKQRKFFEVMKFITWVLFFLFLLGTITYTTVMLLTLIAQVWQAVVSWFV